MAQNQMENITAKEQKEELKKETTKPDFKPIEQRPKAGYWMFQQSSQKGHPAGRVRAVTRDQFMKQQHTPRRRPVKRQGRRAVEVAAPVPMATRLRWKLERGTDPEQWGVQQVHSYIRALPGGARVASLFRSQEIDGKALLLITEDHLVRNMNLKLGPALKLCSHIHSLKRSNSQAATKEDLRTAIHSTGRHK